MLHLDDESDDDSARGDEYEPFVSFSPGGSPRLSRRASPRASPRGSRRGSAAASPRGSRPPVLFDAAVAAEAAGRGAVREFSNEL